MNFNKNPESVNRLEPIRVSRSSKRWPELADLATEVLSASSALGTDLPVEVIHGLKFPCLLANTYASNRIEGHDTSAAEVQRSAEQGFNAADIRDKKRRTLMVEARAHIRTQVFIERLLRFGGPASMYDVLTPVMVAKLHHYFFKGQQGLKIRRHDHDGEPRHYDALPGEFRGFGMDVKVGQHEPPSGASVDELVVSLCHRYRTRQNSILDQILDIPAIHHRLLYLHPFADGNGRIIRLLSHFQIQLAGIGSGGLWSISRGLAVGLERGGVGRGEYLRRMARADVVRQGDLDGRGNLSASRLEDFVEWFLKVMIDQIGYMTTLYELPSLEKRLERSAVNAVPSSRGAAAKIVKAMLRAGSLTRTEAQSAGGLAERQTRTVLRRLSSEGLIHIDRKGTRLLFGSSDLFPKLYPQ